MVEAAARRPDEFHAPESIDSAGDLSTDALGATAAPNFDASCDLGSVWMTCSPSIQSRSIARRSDAEVAGRRTDRVRQMPERWEAIWCSQATSTPRRDAIRTARSGSEAPTWIAGTETGFAGARAATPAATDVASALIDALH